MLKRQSKSDPKQSISSPRRVLVVDDNPDVARLLGKLLRRAGYEVAEVGDHTLALMTVSNEPTPISGLVVSFSGLGNTASLRLLDALRHSAEEALSSARVAMVLEGPRQEMFAWQSGADAVAVRPFRADDLVSAVADMIERGEADRAKHRRTKIDQLRAQADAAPTDGSETTALDDETVGA